MKNNLWTFLIGKSLKFNDIESVKPKQQLLLMVMALEPRRIRLTCRTGQDRLKVGCKIIRAKYNRLATKFYRAGQDAVCQNTVPCRLLHGPGSSPK